MSSDAVFHLLWPWWKFQVLDMGKIFWGSRILWFSSNHTPLCLWRKLHTYLFCNHPSKIGKKSFAVAKTVVWLISYKQESARLCQDAKMLESELYKSLSLFGEDKTLFLWGNNEGLSCTSPDFENVYLKMGKKVINISRFWYQNSNNMFLIY